MITEESLETPQQMPNVYRVLAIMTEASNTGSIYNDGTTYSVLPITADAPEDYLAQTKSQMTVRHYAHEYDLPEGWSIWKWEEFSGFNWDVKYQVRNVSGDIISAERVYDQALAKAR